MEINLNIPTAAEWMRLCPSQIGFVFSKYYSENKDKVVNNWNNFVQSANNGTILDQALIAKWLLDNDRNEEAVPYMIMVHNKMDFYFDYDLGEFYENGEAGLPKDMGIALKLYTNPAVLFGDVPSMIKLGHFYEEGLGSPIDMKEAILWYEQAFDKGDESAGLTIGVRYAQGYHGLKKNKKKALKWLKQASQSSNPEIVDIASGWLANRNEW